MMDSHGNERHCNSSVMCSETWRTFIHNANFDGIFLPLEYEMLDLTFTSCYITEGDTIFYSVLLYVNLVPNQM